MHPRFLFVIALLGAPALAQPSPPTRIKAKLVAVDGDVITLQSATDAKAKPGDVETRRVSLTPETRYVESHKGSFAAIKPGNYAGAVVTVERSGTLRATEAFLYDDALRGSGEGRFTERDRLLVNGTVKSVRPSSPQDTNDGTMTLHYRGATLAPQGKGKAVCEGRAVPAPFASALACESDAIVEISSGTPISALTVGDRGLLVPGSTVTVTIAKVGDRDMVPGIIVEKPQSVP
jgi:hypothetical protein